MTTTNLSVAVYVPNTRQQFTRRVTYMVGYYSGSCFIKRQEYDTFAKAVEKRDQYLERGFDSRIIECRIELFCVL